MMTRVRKKFMRQSVTLLARAQDGQWTDSSWRRKLASRNGYRVGHPVGAVLRSIQDMIAKPGQRWRPIELSP